MLVDGNVRYVVRRRERVEPVARRADALKRVVETSLGVSYRGQLRGGAGRCGPCLFSAMYPSVSDRKSSGEVDHAIRQIVASAVASDQVIDIFAAAGLKNPDISILSDQFLADVQGMPHKNLAVELLRKLLNDEVKTRSRQNLVQSRSFADMLEKSVRRYQSRAIEAAQIIEELIELGKEMREAQSAAKSSVSPATSLRSTMRSRSTTAP